MEELLERIFTESCDLFFVKEINNILSNVNERNLCGRLAMYLNEKISENNLIPYYADPEYNRMQGGKIKTILEDGENVVNINCDIVVHSRGENIKQDNLIAIEMKKSEGTELEKMKDKKRLRALTKDSYDGIWSYDGITFPEHVCGYIFGYYMEINIKERCCILELYKKGEKIKEWLRNF